MKPPFSKEIFEFTASAIGPIVRRSLSRIVDSGCCFRAEGGLSKAYHDQLVSRRRLTVTLGPGSLCARQGFAGRRVSRIPIGRQHANDIEVRLGESQSL